MAHKVHVTFEVATGIQIALNAKSPKGRQQFRDAINAQAALVTPWMREVPDPNPQQDAVRMEVAQGAREKSLDVTVEESVYNYVRDAINEVIEGGKAPHIVVSRIRAADDAITAAKEPLKPSDTPAV